MKHLFWLVAVAVFMFPSSSACGQTNPPAGSASVTDKPLRRVDGQVLISSRLPAVRLEFDRGFKYAGTQSFILYDVATAEQHFFVDVDAQGRIKRMYWIQFEGYLPTNAHTYNYNSTNIVKLGGFDFFADAWARNIKGSPGRPDSDGSRARAFLESKGYRLASDEVLTQRLVHLVDEAKRSELMIIYLEDLGPTGFVATDLSKGGSAFEKWPGVSAALLDRARKSLKVSR
jgi:hypothetical protein